MGTSAGDAGWLSVPEVPPAIAPPAGARLVAHFHAIGAQIYACRVSPAGPLVWSFEAPQASLFDASGKEVGSHGAGPTWSTRDGSRITAKKVAQVNAKAAGAVPWLLLETTSATGSGTLSTVTYVQRVGTARGTAPPDGCLGATLGNEVRVDYAAEYYFYAGGRTGSPQKGDADRDRDGATH
jgi:hypothetical protein